MQPMLKAKHQTAGSFYTSNPPVMASLFRAEMIENQPNPGCFCRQWQATKVKLLLP